MEQDFVKPVPTLTIRTVPFLLGASLVAVLLALARAFDTFPGEEWVLLELRSLRTGWLDDAAVILSGIGKGGIGVGIAFPWIPSLAVAATLCLRRWADAAFLAAALMASVINLGLKELAARPRPDPSLALVGEAGYSFPSGHAVFAATFFGALIVLAERSCFLAARPGLRRSAQAALALLILGVGASRLYLGVHWPGDVVGAFIFAVFYLSALVIVRRFLETRHRQESP